MNQEKSSAQSKSDSWTIPTSWSRKIRRLNSDRTYKLLKKHMVVIMSKGIIAALFGGLIAASAPMVGLAEPNKGTAILEEAIGVTQEEADGGRTNVDLEDPVLFVEDKPGKLQSIKAWGGKVWAGTKSKSADAFNKVVGADERYLELQEKYRDLEKKLLEESVKTSARMVQDHVEWRKAGECLVVLDSMWKKAKPISDVETNVGVVEDEQAKQQQQ